MLVPLAIFVGVVGLVWAAASAAGQKTRVLPREALAILSANPTPDELRAFSLAAKNSGFEAVSALSAAIAEGRKDPRAVRAVQAPPAWVVARLGRLRFNPLALSLDELDGLEQWFRGQGFVAQADMLQQLRWSRSAGIVAVILGGALGWAEVAVSAQEAAWWETIYLRGGFLILLIPPSFFSQRESPEA